MSKTLSWALGGVGLGVALTVMATGYRPEWPDNWPMATRAIAAETPVAAAPPAIPVTVASVAPKTVTAWQDFSGRLEAVERVQVRARVAGVIAAVHFREGGLVKAGDLLVTIDPEPYKAAVAQAQGQVASAEARVALAAAELERGKLLSANSTISKSDLVQRQSGNAEAQANLQSAKAQLRLAELDLGYTEIRAPISARAGKLAISVGNLVAAGAEPLTTLVSVDPIYANFDATEDYVTRLLATLPAENGQPSLESVPVEIADAQGGAAIRGKLHLIDNEVNATSGTIRLRAVFDNPHGRLIPGQFVRLRMGQPEAKERLMISERAVGTDQDKKFVLVVDAANTVQYRQIELGASIDGERVVESGLNAGERIVVNGLQRVRPGAVVAPQTEEQVARQ